ncbi:MAG: hypothetical protein KTR18_01685 [Acidiferrobacterales bacterium]|nr:hypothetical protein [Acidiferrobacterales bacterium]
MKVLFPGLFLCFITLALMLVEAQSHFSGFTNSAGFAIGLILLCIYGAGYLFYRIVSMYNVYKTNIEYQ